MTNVASATNPVLTDYAESSRRHPDPRLIKVGEKVSLGYSDASAYLLTATANYKRLSFRLHPDGQEAVHATIKRIVPSSRNRVTAIVRLVPTSGIQLQDPAHSCAIIIVDLDTGETTLSCNQAGKARITKVSLEPAYVEKGMELAPSGESYWTAFVLFEGKTHRWSAISEHEFQIGELVSIRLTDAGQLVIA